MIRWAVACLWLASPVSAAVTCADVTFDDLSFSTCTVDVATEDLRLFHRDVEGQLYAGFDAIEATLDVETLAFAMNAGMYHRDRAPVGLYIENGVELAPVQPNAGPGNFGLLPNGVLCLNDGTAQVIETLAYLDAKPTCRDVTQSGPMLVIEGDLHPRFLPNSNSRFIRNGVGTSPDGTTAVFAISNQPVNFHTFGRLFRDELGLDQALYFDGKVSRLHARSLDRSDGGLPMGPIIGVID